jgi:hypothetical protein
MPTGGSGGDRWRIVAVVERDAWLSLARLAIAATDAGLLVLAWRQRAAISAVAGLAGTRGGAGRSGIYRGRRGADLAGGPRWRLGALGIALFALGQRLLDQTADGDA